MRRRASLLFTLASCLVSCGEVTERESGLHVVGGDVLPSTFESIGKYKGLVFLRNKGTQTICGAVRLSSFIYLTAGHCVDSHSNPSYYNLRTPNNHVFKEVIMPNVRVHPTFKKTTTGAPDPDGIDLALVEIESLEPTAGGDPTQWQMMLDLYALQGQLNPVGLSAGEKVMVTGGGCIKNQGTQCAVQAPANSNIRVLQSEVVDDSGWKNHDFYFRTLATSMHGLGRGDSGSPVYNTAGAVVGINSFYSSRVNPDEYASYHVRLSAPGVMTWIEENLKEDWNLPGMSLSRANGSSSVTFGNNGECTWVVNGTSGTDKYDRRQDMVTCGPIVVSYKWSTQGVMTLSWPDGKP